MIKHPLYVFIFCVLVAGGCKKKQVLPDLRESYAPADTKPFGASVAHSILRNSFPDNFIQQHKFSFLDWSGVSEDTSSFYFCLTRHFFTSGREADAILDYVYKGNTFFLAAADIDSSFLQKIYCEVEKRDSSQAVLPWFKNTSVSLIEGAGAVDESFRYFYRPFGSSFSVLNEQYCRVLGYNSSGAVNCIVFFWGKGKMFLHTDPRAFSNYFLLTDNNYHYMQEILQLADPSPEHVYWSEYYSRQNNPVSTKSFSTLNEIFKHPAFGNAFLLALLLLLLYVLFGGKRKQRIIKQLTPNVNSSVAFTETVARLYLQENDNRNIADKMITYFNEFIRSNYFLSGNAGSDDFIQALSRKAGVPLDKTISLYRAISHAAATEKLDDYQLLSLNEQIQQFYKKRK